MFLSDPENGGNTFLGNVDELVGFEVLTAVTSWL
jgi:hypothetical protein